MPLYAQGIQARNMQVSMAEDGWYLDADFQVELNAVLEDALQRGVNLPFIVEAELRRARWYWFDQRLPVPPLQWRLSYAPLTQQYRLGSTDGGLSLRFERLDEALRTMGRVRGWRFAPSAQLQKGEEYSLGIRLRLDTAQLPKPFQLNAITQREWSIESLWLRQTVTP